MYLVLGTRTAVCVKHAQYHNYYIIILGFINYIEYFVKIKKLIIEKSINFQYNISDNNTFFGVNCVIICILV